MKLTAPRRLLAVLLGAAILAIGGTLVAFLWQLHLPYVNTVLAIGLCSAGLIVVVLLVWKLFSAFLYKVGRRLAFSYFLLGVLPVPMLLLLLGVVAYLLANFFIGHLYRDALRSIDAEVAQATHERAALYLRTGDPAATRMPTTAAAASGERAAPQIEMAYAFYQNGKRVAGDHRAPDVWPTWTQPQDPAAAAAAGPPGAPGAANGAGAGDAKSAKGAASFAAGATQGAKGAAIAAAGAGAAAGTKGAPTSATGAAKGAANTGGAASAGAAGGVGSGGSAASAGGAGGAGGTGNADAGAVSVNLVGPPSRGGRPRSAGSDVASEAVHLPRFYARADHSPTLAAAVAAGGRGVVGIYAGDLDLELSRRSGVWVESNRPEDPVETMEVRVGSRQLPSLTFHRARNLGEAQMFFKARSLGEGLWDSQILWWGQTSGPLFDLTTGRQIADSVLVQLNGTPRTLKEHLFNANGEIDAASWGLLVGLAVLLANVYAVAALMAMFMIVGLSRAVNRLSSATDAVRRGDFSARIPVRRRDQIGALQRNFNEMSVNLEMLVAASTQKELLEKELALARDLQNSLIPSNLPSDEGIEFATLFEPSAAIGGDYFDVLRLSSREMAVIVADVSGHGLSTGLRMAMLKAALLILIEETRVPDEILRRLDAVIRANKESRFFVTATLATLDLRDGRLSITNAGHPPTYLVRGTTVEEILLPSSPLGGLGNRYAHREILLERGDILVWLSDGLFEGVDDAGEPFGYDRITQALAGGARPQPGPPAKGAARAAAANPRIPTAKLATGPSAAEVRDRLLAAVAAHVGSQPPSDDRTLVVMRWLGAVQTPAVLAAAADTADAVAAR